MAQTFTPEQLGIKAPAGGFKEGQWIQGRHFSGGTFSEPNVIHPGSGAVGAGEQVSREVQGQSAAAQGKTIGDFDKFFAQERQKSTGVPGTPTSFAGAIPDTTGAGGGVPAIATPQTINLAEQYKGLFQSSGIEGLQTQLSAKEKEFTEARGSTNDNPFLDEASRTGRLAKLDRLFQERTANIRSDIARKQADVETRINLELKQFDINSQAAQQALSQFNTLLQMGAYDNATGEDIAGITRSTGISSNAIQSAIASSKKKNQRTQLIQIDDGTNIKAVVVNPDTGQIINSTILSASKPSALKAVSESEKNSYYVNAIKEDASRGAELREVFSLYGGILDPNTILSLYNATSIFGPARETAAELAQFGVKPIKVPEEF